jgi:hypothetical protein
MNQNLNYNTNPLYFISYNTNSNMNFRIYKIKNKILNYNTNQLYLYQMIWNQIWIFEFFNESNSKLQYKLSLYLSYDLNSKNEYLSFLMKQILNEK